MATTGTRDIIGAAMKADPTVTQDVREAVLRIIDGKTNTGLTDDTPLDKIASREEAAKALKVKPHQVTVYARRGEITAMRFGAKGVRAVGYSVQSIRDFMARRASGRAASDPMTGAAAAVA